MSLTHRFWRHEYRLYCLCYYCAHSAPYHFQLNLNPRPNKDKIPNGLLPACLQEKQRAIITLKKSFVQINKLKRRNSMTWAILGSAAVLLLLSNEIVLPTYLQFCAAHLTGSLELTVVLASAFVLCTTISLFNCTTGYLKFIRKNIDPIKSAEKEQKDLKAHEIAKHLINMPKRVRTPGRTPTIHLRPPIKSTSLQLYGTMKCPKVMIK